MRVLENLIHFFAFLTYILTFLLPAILLMEHVILIVIHHLSGTLAVLLF